MERWLARALAPLAVVCAFVMGFPAELAAQSPAPSKPAELSDLDWRSLQSAMSKVLPLQKIPGDRTGLADDASAESQFGTQFGTSVDVDGDTAVVGAWLDDVTLPNQGSAFVFTRVGTTWVQQAHLLPTEPIANDGFGRAIALQGDTIVVGADNRDLGMDADRPGSAYVFRRSGTTWSQEARLIAPDGQNADNFGHAVAISTDTVIIGAPGNDFPGRTNQGSAYIFVRSGSVWTFEAQVEPIAGGTNDRFGDAVAISGDTAIVGSYLAGADDRGAAFVYVRTGTTWSPPTALPPGDPSGGARFGFSVDVTGDDAIVGAVGINAAYVFVRSSNVWSQQQRLQRTPPASGEFGHNVKIVGDRVLIAAVVETAVDPVEPTITTGNAGAAYIFERSGTVWTQQARLASPTPVFDDALGIWVALSGDTALIGCYRCDPRGILNVGSALVFVRSGTNWVLESDLMPDDGSQDDRFGANISVSGDTAIVGVARDDLGTRIDQGSAYVFVRNGINWDQQARLVASDGAAGDEFGNAVSLSGDTAIIGAVHDDVGANSNQGSAYVFVRTGATWTQQAKLVSGDGASADEFGAAVSVDGDSAIIGAISEETAPAVDRGAAYVFTRSGTTWTELQKLVPALALSDDRFGVAVAIHGDTAVGGAHMTDIGANSDQGAAYVYTRSGGIFAEQQRLTAGDGETMDMFGTAVALQNDTVIVGAPEDDAPLSATGSAYVYTRSGGVWTQQAQLQAADRSQSDRFGYSVALLGDLVLVGAYTDAANANTNQGSAYLFARNGQTWTQRGKLIAGDGAVADQFGSSVGLATGVALVGAWMDNANYADEGAVYVFTSGEFATVSLPPGTQSTVNAPATFVVTVAGSSTMPADGAVTVTASTGESCSDSSAAPGSATSATFSCAITFASTGSRTMTASFSGSSTHDPATGTATHTVQALPSLTIGDASGTEGTGGSASLTFAITRSHALNEVSVTVASTDGSATSGADYVALAATVITLPAGGALSTQVQVPLVTDALVESNETFTLALSAPTGATIADGSATGTITNDDSIVVSPASLASAAVGESYSTMVSAANGTAPYGFAVTSGAIAPGLTLAPGGLLSGTPTQAGTHAFTVTATDSASAGAGGPFTGSRAYMLVVNPDATTTAVVSDTNATVANLPVVLTATVEGFAPTGTVQFRNGASAITGCTSAPLSGVGNSRSAQCMTTALPVGARSITAAYSGDSNNVTSTSSAITVTISAPTIDVGPASLPNAQAGVAYAQSLSASGAGSAGPYAFSIVAGSLPPGIDLANGSLSGSTNATGTFNVTIRATDSSTAAVGGPFMGQRTYSINVGLQPTTTTIGTITPSPVAINVAYEIPVNVTAAQGTPSGLVLVSNGTQNCNVTLGTGGNKCSLTSTTAGTKTITATYFASGNYGGSSAETMLTVTGGTVGAVVSVADRIGFRDRLVTVPISIRGDGTTVKFSARMQFDPTQFQGQPELRAVAPATCTMAAGNLVEVSTLGSTRQTPLPAIETPYCDVTFRLQTTPASEIVLSIDAETTACRDASGATAPCLADNGRILVSGLATQPESGTNINIAGFEGQATESRVLIFTNVGTVPVGVTGCTVTGTGFRLTEAPVSPIATGASTRALVECDLPAFAATRFGGLLECDTTDAARDTLSFGLSCTSVPQGSPLPGDQVFNNSLKQGDEFGRAAAVTDGVPTGSRPTAKGNQANQLMVIGAPNAGSDSAGRVFIFAGDLTPKARTSAKSTSGGIAALLSDSSLRLVNVVGPPRDQVKRTGKILVGDKFGSAVAVSPTGTRIAVGAPAAGGGDRGQVFIYDQPPGGWGELDIDDYVGEPIDAPPSDGLLNPQEFGATLAFTGAGDLVVGAPGTDSITSSNIGAVYFYESVGAGFAATPERSGSLNPVPNGRFGAALAANDAMIVVGAPQEGAANSQTGAAYVMRLANGLPTPPERFGATTATLGDKFGSSVAVGAGGMVIVGAASDDIAGAGDDSGSATVFRAPIGTGTPIEITTLAPGPGASQGAGASVATNGDVIVIGAPLFGEGGVAGQGRAYVYEVEPQFATATSPLPRRLAIDALSNNGGQANDLFGHAVAINRYIAVAGVPLDDRVVEDGQPAVEDIGRADPFALERIFRSDFE